MKPILCVFAAAFACVSHADRLVLMPTGKKIPYRSFRVENQVGVARRDESRSYLGFGLNQYFDAELAWGDLHGDSDSLTVDFAFNFVDPIVEYTPGLSIGVRDALNRSERGRSVYLAATTRIGLDSPYNYDTPLEVTLGYSFRPEDEGVFAGLLVPFTRHFRVLAEMNNEMPLVGIEIRPRPDAALRWVHREGLSFWSLSFSRRL